MIAIITDPGKGGTFLTWSIYYLSGVNDYYYSLSNNNIKLPTTPITNINAHNFLPNQPNTLDDYVYIFNDIYSHSSKNNTLDIIYSHTLTTIDSGVVSIKDTTHSFNILSDNNIKTLVLSNNKTISNENLYNCCYEQRASQISFIDGTSITSDTERLSDYINYYFKNDIHYWKDLNYDNKWELREFLALNMRPFDYKYTTIHESVDNVDNFNYYYINTNQLWLNIEYIIPDIFNYLELSLNNQRFKIWKNVYNQWKQLHTDRITFVWYFDTIIKNIINNVDMDLNRFNLDIIREAAIQHTLLYSYNLNLKSHGINNFSNTKQIHNLLEPNIYHTLT